MLAQFPTTFRRTDPVAPVPAGDLAANAEKHPTRVLVVDDEPLVRWAIVETLGATGYTVDEVGDAESTIRVLVESRPAPDVVLLDLRLPDSDDLGLLESIRRLAPTAVVILMTAFGTPDLCARALGCGAACVLDKPFDVDLLDCLITTLRTSA